MATGGLPFGSPMAQANTLIINNLPDYFHEEELKTMFSTFGSVKTARINRNPMTNQSIGFGFVEYSTRKEAAKAIEEVNGLQLGKKKLRVAFSEPVGEAVKQATKIIVKQIPGRYKEEEFKDMFTKFGNIVKVRLLTDSVTGRSRRMGFIFFEKWADAQRAMNEMNEFKPEKSKELLKVKMDSESVKPKAWPQWQKASYQQPVPIHQPHGPHPYSQTRPHSQTHTRTISAIITPGPNPVCVFLYNIGEFITEQEIYNLFAQFGGLNKIDVVRDMNTHQCKGYAFLSFETYQAAETAIFTMDGIFYRGRQLQVRFKYS